jgi:hypothetical protein
MAVLAWRDWGKPRKLGQDSLSPDEIWTRALPNKKQGCKPLDPNVRWTHPVTVLPPMNTFSKLSLPLDVPINILKDDDSLLGYCTVYSDRNIPRCLLSQSSADSKHLWNVGLLLQDYTVQDTRRLLCSYSPPWEPEISQHFVCFYVSHSFHACHIPCPPFLPPWFDHPDSWCGETRKYNLLLHSCVCVCARASTHAVAEGNTNY